MTRIPQRCEGSGSVIHQAADQAHELEAQTDHQNRMIHEAV